ncbi:MAG: ATP-binding cassette domain-containing protein [Sarcina sp.]
MREVVLKTHDLTKKYGEQLSNNKINITVKKGDIYGLIGKNGAGKTTLMRLITGLAYKTSGEIELFGKSTEKEINDMRAMIGSLIETPAFYPNMTAKENLEISRLYRNIAGDGGILEVLKLVGLENTGNKKFKNFSLGMKQRLGIANALLGNPKVLILDEPINGLDPMGIVEVRELIKTLNREKEMTVIISSHILGELSELATCYGIISDGKLLEEISEEALSEKCKQYIEIKAKEKETVVAILEMDLNITDYKVLEGNIIKIFSNLDDVALINSELSKRGVLIESIRVKGETLEEYFVELVGGAK